MQSDNSVDIFQYYSLFFESSNVYDTNLTYFYTRNMILFLLIVMLRHTHWSPLHYYDINLYVE
jgi:hypothetical protein